MALATSVTDDGKVVGGGVEIGSYSQSITKKDNSVWLLTTYFSDVREEKKWYALTYAAITAYIAANPTANVCYSMTSDVTNGYDMTVTKVTRTTTGWSFVELDEPA